MPPLSKKHKALKEHCLINSRKIQSANKCLECWKTTLVDFNEWDLKNPQGRTRSSDENKILLLALRMLLTMEIENVEAGLISIHSVNWTKLEKHIAKYMHVRWDYVKELRTSLFEDGDILQFGGWSGNENSPNKNSENDAEDDDEALEARCVLTKRQVQHIVDEVDYQHSIGETVTRQKIIRHLKEKHNIAISKSTMSRYFKRAGLSYSPIKTKQRKRGEYRQEIMRDYILEFNDLYMKKDDPAYNFMLVFTDESYCYQNHSRKDSWMKPDSIINKTSSKGERLIILHAISSEKPLAELDVDTGMPIDDIHYPKNDNIPACFERKDNKFTAECMWKASIRTGDYHDNMNSEMFYNWVVNKLVPTFENMYEGKQMILIMDNAAYHHARDIGTLGSMKKSDIEKLCDEHDVKYIDIPINEQRMNVLSADTTISAHIQDNDYCRVYLNNNVDVFERASSSQPMIPTVDELKVAIIQYFNVHKPELLECKVEKYLKERGHKVLWTPPYSPDLQPIELFWAAGKNHVAGHMRSGITMREVIALLRQGWYGDPPAVSVDDEFGATVDDQFRKSACKCDRLLDHVVKMINKKFIKMCDGLEGTIGNLIIHDTHVPNYSGLPIDMMLVDLTNDDPDDFFGDFIEFDEDIDEWLMQF